MLFELMKSDKLNKLHKSMFQNDETKKKNQRVIEKALPKKNYHKTFATATFDQFQNFAS